MTKTTTLTLKLTTIDAIELLKHLDATAARQLYAANEKARAMPEGCRDSTMDYFARRAFELAQTFKDARIAALTERDAKAASRKRTRYQRMCG